MKRKILIAAVLAAATFAMDAPAASANNRVFRGQRRPIFQSSRSGNMFSGLMDLERRKNAWLRSVFFGG